MRRVIALACVVGIFAINAPASWAAPGDSDTTTDSQSTNPTLTLSLADLGSTANLPFYGQDTAQLVSVPVLHGLKPTAMNATVVLPTNLRSGTLTVTQEEHIISTVNLPMTDQAQVVIPLAGAEVVDNSVTVTVRAYLVPTDGFCFYPWSPLRLINGMISYTGVEQPPTTVADFLPPVLRKLTIFLPQSPSEAESDTAVQLATEATARYSKQSPEIAVVALPGEQWNPPTPRGPLERQVVIKEGPDSGLSIQGPPGAQWLLITGSLGRSDVSNTELLFNDLSRLAVSPKAAAGSLKSNLQLPGNNTTLRDLGQSFANSVALQPRVSIALDQTRFGRSMHSVRMHLHGSYSPTPPNVGGQIEVSIGPETIDHWATDGHGVIDRWIDVPDRLLQRYTNLDLVLDVPGNLGHCGDFFTVGPGNQLLTLNIDGDSTVESKSADPPVPDGLRSVPQTLMPLIRVGIEPRSFSDTVRAVQLMIGLQRISTVPLDASVTSAQKVIDSANPGVVIAADGWDHRDVVLPVSAGQSGPITVNTGDPDAKPTTLTLDPAIRFASLQAVYNRGRTLLVATSNGAPGQLDELLRWLSDGTRWPRLDGAALVSIPGQEPVNVERPNTGAGPPVAMPKSHSSLGWLLWLGGAWLAVAVIGAAVLVIRSRRGPRRS